MLATCDDVCAFELALVLVRALFGLTPAGPPVYSAIVIRFRGFFPESSTMHGIDRIRHRWHALSSDKGVCDDGTSKSGSSQRVFRILQTSHDLRAWVRFARSSGMGVVASADVDIAVGYGRGVRRDSRCTRCDRWLLLRRGSVGASSSFPTERRDQMVNRRT